MHEECVPPETLAVARELAGVAASHELALGGGTACALHLGHRASRDLDFFSLRKLSPPDLLADFRELDAQRLRGISESELHLAIGEVDVFATALGRPPLEAPGDWRGLRVLGMLDLAELKVEAAVRRGTLRDLCDLHLLCVGGVNLGAALEAAPTDAVVALKALTDPARFREQPELALRRPWSVEEATAYFATEARRLLR